MALVMGPWRQHLVGHEDLPLGLTEGLSAWEALDKDLTHPGLQLVVVLHQSIAAVVEPHDLGDKAGERPGAGTARMPGYMAGGIILSRPDVPPTA